MEYSKINAESLAHDIQYVFNDSCYCDMQAEVYSTTHNICLIYVN